MTIVNNLKKMKIKNINLIRQKNEEESKNVKEEKKRKKARELKEGEEVDVSFSLQ